MVNLASSSLPIPTEFETKLQRENVSAASTLVSTITTEESIRKIIIGNERGFAIFNWKQLKPLVVDIHDVDQAMGEVSYPPKTYITTALATCIGIAAKCFSKEGLLVRTALYHYDGIDVKALSKFFNRVVKDQVGYEKVAKCHLFLAGSYRPLLDSENTPAKPEVLKCLSQIGKPSTESATEYSIIGSVMSLIQQHHVKNSANKVIFAVAHTIFNPWNIRPNFNDYERDMDEVRFNLAMIITKDGLVGLADNCIDAAYALKKGAFLQYDEFLENREFLLKNVTS